MAVATSAPKETSVLPGATSMRNFFLIYLHKVNSLLHTHTHTQTPPPPPHTHPLHLGWQVGGQR